MVYVNAKKAFLLQIHILKAKDGAFALHHNITCMRNLSIGNGIASLFCSIMNTVNNFTLNKIQSNTIMFECFWLNDFGFLNNCSNIKFKKSGLRLKNPDNFLTPVSS
jgi:hypothetical protein